MSTLSIEEANIGGLMLVPAFKARSCGRAFSHSLCPPLHSSLRVYTNSAAAGLTPGVIAWPIGERRSQLTSMSNPPRTVARATASLAFDITHARCFFCGAKRCIASNTCAAHRCLDAYALTFPPLGITCVARGG
ncbi:hypothetical protein OPV22_031440 [Ensete ventricosum]|uniref:Uncharacterized protein n=1 Tax=Ensete ventricosum TaxID=4639 RepID=A0AAV8PJ61_ENSVE|nr:hypothetical protein OPV22_031440 [Ensete ventricosum]